MKTKFYSLLVLCGLGLSAMAQTYTGTAWKAGGWNFGADNNANFAVGNVIDAWQYDKGNYMPLPTDFATAVADFKAGNYAAGQVLSNTVTPANLTSDATMGTRMVWDATNNIAVGLVYRKAYLNKRKGDTTDRLALSASPTVTVGTEVLDPTDPALFANPAAFCMNDAYGRLGTGGAAMRYSVNFVAGNYNLLFKGNATTISKIRILSRATDNTLTEVYSGTVSASFAANMNTKVTNTGTSTEFAALAGYEKLLENMKLYATGATFFSLQNNTSAGAPAATLLELPLSGNYVVEIVNDAASGNLGAFTFKNTAPPSSVVNPKINMTNVLMNDNSLIVKLNGIGESSVNIFNTTGALIVTRDRVSDETQISTSNFSKGIYLVKIENNKHTELHKIIIK